MHGILLNHPKKSWIVLFALCFLIFLLNIDCTGVNLILVTVSKEMDVDLNILQWTLSGYLLAWSAGVVSAGKLADLFGKRRFLLYGLWVFIVGSLVCALATGPWVLIGGRVIQGLGGALFVPPIYALIFQEFSAKKTGMAIGMIGVGAGIGLALGPTIGGYILEFYGWRWIFLINIPLCLTVISIILMSVEVEPKRVNKGSLNKPGALLLALSLVAFMYAINEIEVLGIYSQQLWMLGGGVVLLFGAFFLSQKGSKNPLVPHGLFLNKPYLACFFGFMFFNYMFAAMLILAALYLQNILGYSAFDAGLIFLPATAVFGVMSPFGGRFTDKMDPRIPACLGMGLLSLSCVGMAAFDAQTSLGYIICVFIVFGAGLGLALAPYNSTFLKAVRPEILTTASGAFNMGATLGCSLGIVLSSSLLVGVAQLYLPDILLTSHLALSPEHVVILNDILANAHRDYAPLAEITTADKEELIGLINAAAQRGFAAAMYVAALMGVLGLFIAAKWLKVPRE